MGGYLSRYCRIFYMLLVFNGFKGSRFEGREGKQTMCVCTDIDHSTLADDVY